MLKENEKIKYLPGEKSLKALLRAYVDLECIFKKNTILSKYSYKISYRKKS